LPNIGPGGFVVYGVQVSFGSFRDNLCFTASAKVAGDLEPGPADSTQNKLVCLADGPPCPQPPPNFCPGG
jgi:hypothetical protein